MGRQKISSRYENKIRIVIYNITKKRTAAMEANGGILKKSKLWIDRTE